MRINARSSGLRAGRMVAAPAIDVHRAWHRRNDHCTWSTVRDVNEFDEKNHWLIERGEGSSLPSVNVSGAELRASAQPAQQKGRMRSRWRAYRPG